MLMTLEQSGLSADLYEASIRHIVEDEKKRYSDEALWTWLLELYDKEVELLKLIPYAFRGCGSAAKWMRYHKILVEQWKSTRSMIELIVWHLEMRGDNSIVDWVKHTDAYKNSKELEWQNFAYRSWNKPREGMVQ